MLAKISLCKNAADGRTKPIITVSLFYGTQLEMPLKRQHIFFYVIGLAVKVQDKFTVGRLHTHSPCSAKCCSCGTFRRKFVHVARRCFVSAPRIALAHGLPVRNIDAHVRPTDTLVIVSSKAMEMTRYKPFGQFP